MPNLLDVMQHLQETEAALARLRGDVARGGSSRSATLTLNSLRKRYGELEALFASLADQEQLDVFSYKLIAEKEGDPYTITALTKTLGDFQNLLTLVYDAIKSGQRKIRAQVSAEIASETALNFGYSYSGSLGFVFTMPNERLLLVDSAMDMAMQTVFEMAKAKDTTKLAEYAKALGPAPIRLMYRWASDHLQSNLSADLQWNRNEEIKSSLVIQKEELAALCRAIEETSEERSEEFDVPGVLRGGDLDSRTFHISHESGGDIKGYLSEDYKSDIEMTLGEHYHARILKKTKVHFSTEKEDEYYYLISLRK